jgi:hypothetical protein
VFLSLAAPSELISLEAACGLAIFADFVARREAMLRL